ncbi:OmpA family protein [Luteimonas gilva]|uniref:OmpA family protein n=1 Tax=Luteimonas gilva TaxID=2572684 RepID=A0A4U5K4B9_9GAMM|nr:OmpA family protein [Luteimonas gilva]
MKCTAFAVFLILIATYAHAAKRVMDEDGRCAPYQPAAYIPESKDGEPVIVLDIGAWPPGMTFRFDQVDLTPYTKRTLDEAVKSLNEYPDLRVEVSGHTDSIGTRRYNQDLSVRRAAVAYKYLIDHGIKPSRLTWAGYGETRFIAPNTTEDGKDYPDGRCRNRRIELNVLN